MNIIFFDFYLNILILFKMIRLDSFKFIINVFFRDET